MTVVGQRLEQVWGEQERVFREGSRQTVKRREHAYVAVEVDDGLSAIEQMTQDRRLQRAAQLGDVVADAHRLEVLDLDVPRAKNLEGLLRRIDEAIDRVDDQHRHARIWLVGVKRLGERACMSHPGPVDHRADVHPQALYPRLWRRGRGVRRYP